MLRYFGVRPMPEQVAAHFVRFAELAAAEGDTPDREVCPDGGQETLTPDETTTSVDTLAILDRETGAHAAYEGPFRRERTGDCIEIAIPIGSATDPGQINDHTAKILTNHVGRLAVTTRGTGIDTTGIIEAAEIVGRTVGIQINDSLQRSPEPLDIDFDDVDMDIDNPEAATSDPAGDRQ